MFITNKEALLTGLTQLNSLVDGYYESVANESNPFNKPYLAYVNLTEVLKKARPVNIYCPIEAVKQQLCKGMRMINSQVEALFTIEKVDGTSIIPLPNEPFLHRGILHDPLGDKLEVFHRTVLVTYPEMTNFSMLLELRTLLHTLLTELNSKPLYPLTNHITELPLVQYVERVDEIYKELAEIDGVFEETASVTA